MLERELGEPAEVSVLLCDDGEMRGLNSAYRKIDSPTDVLSFSQEDGDVAPDGRRLLGDIVVSVETAARQAKAQGHDLETEVVLLGLHGALHLLGYEDDTDEGAARMLRMAEEAVEQLGRRPGPKRGN